MTIRIKAMGFLSGSAFWSLAWPVGFIHRLRYRTGDAPREEAELAFTYQNDKLKGRVEEFAALRVSSIILPCDVAEDASIDAMFAGLGNVWPKFDGFVHSIGFARQVAGRRLC